MLPPISDTVSVKSPQPGVPRPFARRCSAVVVVRSRHQQQTQGAGRMAAVALTHDAARAILAELESTAEVWRRSTLPVR